MASTNDNQDAITSINVTPFVDVMLVLLIILMATAPLLQRRALHVQIPKAARSERVATETVRVEFGLKGDLMLDGKTLNRTDLLRELSNIVAHEPAAHVAVAADRKIPYGEIVALLDDIRGAGVQRVGLEVQRR